MTWGLTLKREGFFENAFTFDVKIFDLEKTSWKAEERRAPLIKSPHFSPSSS